MEADDNADVRARVEKTLALLAQPFDPAELEKQGLLVKAGAWHRVPDLKRLPENAITRIREMSTDSKGPKVKFSLARARKAPATK